MTAPKIHPGEHLKTRFLEPLGLTAADLAHGCRMPRSRVSEILAGKRRISTDTALRLAAYFRMEPEAWLALQADWDLHQATLDDRVEPLDPPGYLLGPAGATRIPQRPRAEPPHLRMPGSPASQDAEVSSEGRRPTGTRIEHEEVRYADGTRALVAARR